MDKDLGDFFRKAKEVRLQAAEKEALRPLMNTSVDHDSVRGEADTCQNSHMTWSFDRFIAASQTLRLTDRERTQSFERVLVFMEAHPVMPASEPQGSSNPLALLAALFSSLRLMPALAFALLLLIGAGTTSVAAESALPGSPLYPVKIHVNEAVRVALAASPEAQARMQTQLVERRLAEARELTTENILDRDAEIEQMVGASIARQVSAARAKITALAEENNLDAAADVNTELEAAVKAHRKVFARLGKATPSSLQQIVLSALTDADDMSVRAQANLQTKISNASAGAVQAIANRGIEAAQRRTDAMKAFLETKGSEIGVQARGEMEARLKSAQDALAQARARLQEGSAGAAMSIAAQANADAQEGQALGSVQQLINVEVNTTGGDADTKMEVNATGDALPQVKIGGNGKATVKINGKQITTPLSGAASSVSLSSGAQSSRTSSVRPATQQQMSVSVQVNQQTSAGSANTTVNSNTNVNTSTNVNVQGGGSVQIHQSAGVSVNSNVQIGD
jgi:hypothetical protein